MKRATSPTATGCASFAFTPCPVRPRLRAFRPVDATDFIDGVEECVELDFRIP
ncbi:MAG TPA: hypothetical protein VJL90_02450 [Pseudorhodoplanes sp.]|nr:hypothetical protein [Pseudorhodoplanes sp.]